MRGFLERLSSRKFLTALAVQVAAVAAIFAPDRADAWTDAAIKISALLTLLLAAMGYGKIEADVDAARTGRH